MELEKAKQWIRHTETRDLLESAAVPDSEWITVHRREESVFESVRHMPFLIGPRKLHRCLDDTGWGACSSLNACRFVFPGRRRFLLKEFADSYPDARFLGAHYEDPKRGILARFTVEHADDTESTQVEVRIPILQGFLSAKNRRLLLGVETFRYSERTLSELGLEHADGDFSGETFRYAFSARIPGGFGGSRRMFSTITGILGRKLVCLPGATALEQCIDCQSLGSRAPYSTRSEG